MTIERTDALIQHAHSRPRSLAMVDLATGRSFDYEQMDRRVLRLARALQQDYGVCPGERVAVLSRNSTDVFEIQFACWRIGAIFVPVNWRLTIPEIAYILGDCAPRLLIADAAFGETVEGLAACGALPQCLVRGTPGSSYDALVDDDSADTPSVALRVPIEDTASLIYTSGTTGRPKGARISHRMELFSYLNYICATALSRASRTVVALPLFHVGGLNCFPNPIFYLGGTVFVMESFDARAFLTLLSDREKGITHVFGVPTILAAMAREPGFDQADFSHLCSVVVGGASVPLPLIDALQQRGVPIQQGWGMTESTSLGSILALDQLRDKPASAGLPVQHVRMRIANEFGNAMPAGEVGELQVQGPSITSGYWNRPDADRSAFVDGWFRTGDAARLDDEGYLYIVDRWTDMYISGGENVYPAEIESVLAEVNGIVEAAVIGIADERWGQVGRAFIVRSPDSRLSANDVVAHCDGRLARYKIPREVVFVDQLPHNAAGKLLKQALPRTPLPAAHDAH